MSRPRSLMRTMIVDHRTFAFCDTEIPQPATNEALIRVSAISLDQVDVEQAFNTEAGGTIPGWDFAGTVEVAASDRSELSPGTRVAGLKQAGAWAEFVAVPSNAFAAMPNGISFVQAATLPIAGLTAMHGLSCDGLLLAQRVLITRATGSVGLLAVQLAHASGAEVTAVIATFEHEALLEEYGADHVVVGEAGAAGPSGPYDFIIDGVEGLPTDVALSLLSENGTYALYKDDARRVERTIGQAALLANRLRYYDFASPGRLHHLPLSVELQRLFSLVKTHTIQPHVEFEASWLDVANVVQRLACDDPVGKAVLHVRT